MKIFFYFITVFLFLTAALNKWYLDISFRINFYEIAMILFLIAYFLYGYETGSLCNFIKNKQLKTYILFLWGYLGIVILSGFSLIYASVGSDSYNFYFKGVLQLFIHVVYFTFLMSYIIIVSPEMRKKLINWFIAGVVISAVYGFAQIFMIKLYGIDLDKDIAHMMHFSGSGLGFKRYAYGYFFRLNGITGDPSVHAAYTITAIPFFMLTYLENKYKKHNTVIFFIIILLFVSLVLSMSVSGFIGLTFSIITLFFMRIRKIRLKNLLHVLMISIVLMILYYVFQEDILYFASFRTDPSGSIRSHYEILLNSLNIWGDYISGVGFNNFSIVYEKYYGVYGFNPHNTWALYLVQLGFIGLFCQVGFVCYIIYQAFKKKSFLSQVFISSIIGLVISSLGYEIFDMFFVQLYIVLFFTAIVLDGSANQCPLQRSSNYRTCLKVPR